MPDTPDHRRSALPILHAPQGMARWDGPAAVRMALGTRLGPLAATQWALAQRLDRGLRTVAEALNTALDATGYAVRAVGQPPSPAERAGFTRHLVGRIDAGWPLVSAFVLRAGGLRPPGYPAGRADGVRHTVTVYGYADAGTTALIADPASGSAAIAWSDDVPPFYALAVDELLELMAGAGYVA